MHKRLLGYLKNLALPFLSLANSDLSASWDIIKAVIMAFKKSTASKIASAKLLSISNGAAPQPCLNYGLQ